LGFQAFALISLFYAVIGIGVIRKVIRHRKELFDLNFTPADRSLVDQAAFFILVPISVALHECGHAIMVKVFGGQITGFGYYVFAGYVSHQGYYTNAQMILIAFAGPFVNFLLAAAAIAVVLLRKPPMRAACNELLIEFAVISMINAFVIYPMLDFATNLEGDWKQIYQGGDTSLSAMIGAFHLALLVGSFWLSRYPPFRRHLAVLTGLPAGSERGLLGRNAQLTAPEVLTGSPVALMLREAAERVAGGWPEPVEGRVQPVGSEIGVWLTWRSGGLTRGVTVVSRPDGGANITGFAEPTATFGQSRVQHRSIRQVEGPIDANSLTLTLRQSMEQIDTWAAPTFPSVEPFAASGTS
jgi:hypothetical protein